jgi:hypothetical protein
VEYGEKGRGGAERAKNGGEGRGNSLNLRRKFRVEGGMQRVSDAPHSLIGEVKSYRLIYFIREMCSNDKVMITLRAYVILEKFMKGM